MERHVYVQAIVLEKDPKTGDVIIRAITNQGRFIIGNDTVDTDITGSFYSYVRDLAIKEVEKILATETDDSNVQKLRDNLKAALKDKQPPSPPSA